MSQRKLQREAGRISALKKSMSILLDRLMFFRDKCAAYRQDKGCTHTGESDYVREAEAMIGPAVEVLETLRYHYNEIVKVMEEDDPRRNGEAEADTPEVPPDLY